MFGVTYNVVYGTATYVRNGIQDAKMKERLVLWGWCV